MYMFSKLFVLLFFLISLRSRRIKGREWGGERRIREKNRGEGGGRGKRNACYKDPYWFISAVADGRKILIG